MKPTRCNIQIHADEVPEVSVNRYFDPSFVTLSIHTGPSALDKVMVYLRTVEEAQEMANAILAAAAAPEEAT